jgi:hypothetical protein
MEEWSECINSIRSVKFHWWRVATRHVHHKEAIELRKQFIVGSRNVWALVKGAGYHLCIVLSSVEGLDNFADRGRVGSGGPVNRSMYEPLRLISHSNAARQPIESRPFHRRPAFTVAPSQSRDPPRAPSGSGNRRSVYYFLSGCIFHFIQRWYSRTWSR